MTYAIARLFMRLFFIITVASITSSKKPAKLAALLECRRIILDAEADPTLQVTDQSGHCIFERRKIYPQCFDILENCTKVKHIMQYIFNISKTLY
ncbi:Protein of unknown function [Pyronema omphalodes CBS 100304]|uniref:Secreted protein n=1 Tax=Pyronema omphalodes (strain CBS 100304) TaxID=1076935 RepID=U4LKR2_PYROM|nr:Protein of unknown function [Pyronema omphalodes CBS 100304]